MADQTWQPSASIMTLKRRAQLLADVRHFFAQRQVMEVETPIMSHAAPTAPYLDSFESQYQASGGQAETCYLQTSPEFAMKRLIAAGCDDIYQIARVFRNGEIGHHHSPEFTMLEWYRPSLDYLGLMHEVDALLQQVASLPAAQYFSYRQIFEKVLQVNPHQLTDEQLAALAFEHISSLPPDWETDRDGWLEMLMSQVIEPVLAEGMQPSIIYDFPKSQAQLAKLHTDAAGELVAARFEVYAAGLELANGYDECVNAEELRKRFEHDNELRSEAGKKLMPIDAHLINAIEHGFPACTGVALGLDRLMMLVSGQTQLEAVLAFHFSHS